jgi:hypothetical protein
MKGDELENCLNNRLNLPFISNGFENRFSVYNHQQAEHK